MTTDELRAAAEMVVATGMDKDWADTIDAGALAVARAWLAANPADDGLAVTEEWLSGLGFAPAWGHKFNFDAPDIDVRCTPEELVLAHRTDEYLVCDNPTRGHVRRLLAALGVTP